MNKAIAGESKKIKAEVGKLKKIIAAIKKALSKELLWILFVVTVSVPVSLICSYLLRSASIDLSKVFVIITENRYPSFAVLYIICGFGIYFSRLVALAIKTQFETK